MADPAFISDEELWALRYKLRRELIEFARRRLLMQASASAIGLHRLRPTAESRRADHRLCPPLRHLQARAADLRPIRQHREIDQRPPAARAVHLRRQGPSARRRRQALHPAHHSPQQIQRTQGQLVFIENYDVHVARQMVSGCDVWLNNPRRPLEASGTSGRRPAATAA